MPSVIMKKKYPVILTEAQREQLKSLIAAGTAPARKLTLASCLKPTRVRRERAGWMNGECTHQAQATVPFTPGVTVH